MQFFNGLLLVGADLLDESDRRVVDALLRSSDQLLAVAERLHLSVELGDLRLPTATFLVVSTRRGHQILRTTSVLSIYSNHNCS